MFNNQLHHFYNTLFTEKLQMQNENITAYLSLISIPVLAGEQSQKCEGPILESELLKALKNMSNNKSPRNDGLTKEVYERFWEDLKKPLCASITKAFQRGELSHSQKEAVIKLIEKKDRDKKLIKNWRPISLLNINTKLISEVLAERLKNVLPFLISSDQTGYVKGRFISEGGRLISDVLEICDKLQIKGFLMTVDIEKAFDSISHCLLIKVLEKYCFEKDFIKWIKILLQNQEACIVNGGSTTNYFKLEKGTRQGDPISAYFFILVLEIVFSFTKESQKLNGLDIFDKTILYTAYVDDTTFFLKDTKSVIELMNIFDTFSKFSGLKPNKSKCEIAGIGVLKGVQVALCGMRCIDLVSNIVKILGIYFSHNEKLEIQENFKRHMIKIEKILPIWRIRDP